MLASARFQARCLPHHLPQFFLVISPPAAVEEEVLPRLEHCPSTPPALVVISVAKPCQVYSSGQVPGLQSLEPSGQQLYACHRDRSLGPCLALESVAEVLAAPVGFPLRLGCCSCRLPTMPSVLLLSASHYALAADLPSEIRLALFKAEVYGCSFTVLPPASRAQFA